MIKITFKQLLSYVFGAFCIAIALQMFQSPNHIVAGGVSGLGIILENLSNKYLGFGVPLWMTNTAINVPLLIASYKIRGKDILIRSAIVVGLLSTFLWALDFVNFEAMDIAISTVAGAVIMGFGLGNIFKNGATSGGTDLLAAVITKIVPSLKISRVLFFIDFSIIVLGFLVFGVEKGLYGLATVFLCAKTIDYVLVGGDVAKAAVIVSEKSEELANKINEEMNITPTVLRSKGNNSDVAEITLYCVVPSKEITKLKEIVRNIDNTSFMAIGEVHEVVGAGFKSHNDTSL